MKHRDTKVDIKTVYDAVCNTLAGWCTQWMDICIGATDVTIDREYWM